MTEKDLLQTQLEKPIILLTYTQPQQIQKSVKVRKYDLQVDQKQIVKKIDVLFAFGFKHYQTIKAGIKLNNRVKAMHLNPIPKIKDRPHVVTPQEYQAGVGQQVKLTMRTGHILTGEQVKNTEYNLILNIEKQHVLVYKHGILEYQG